MGETNDLMRIEDKNIINGFDKIKALLKEYQDKFFYSFIDTSSYDSKIVNELGSIRESFKPLKILQEGASFIVSMKRAIKEIKENNKQIGHSEHHDNYNLLSAIFYGYGSDLNIKKEEHIREFDNTKETEAYKTIRNELQNIVDDNEREGIVITFSLLLKPDDDIYIVINSRFRDAAK